MKKYYFTFMQTQNKLKNKYVTFWGSYAEARAKMVANFGTLWAFQYSEEEWMMEGKTQAEHFNLTEIK